MKILVVGAGFVGLVTAVCFAARGNQVICIEKNAKRLAMISCGKAPFYEPRLQELLVENIQAGRLTFFDDIKQTIGGSDLVFVAVGTPNSSRRIDLSQIQAAARDIGASLLRFDQYTVVAIKSTVVPGSTAGPIRAALESASGKSPGSGFGLCMNPEFLRQGSAIADFLNSDRIVIGAQDSRSADIALAAYSGFDCPKLVTTLQNAELCKYTSNVLLATLISFSNEIASICERVPGTDVEFVMDAVSLDRRLSPLVDGKRISPEILKYLRAGSGFGGSCLPKDIDALRQTAREHGVEPLLLDAVVAVNLNRPGSLMRLAERVIGPLLDRKVALLGLTFKPGTDDLRDSPALALLERLVKAGAQVTAFDPLVHPQAALNFDCRVQLVSDAIDALDDAEVAFIATAWPQFAEIDWTSAAKRMRHPILIDGRNALRRVNLPPTIRYFGIGRAEASS
jgi:UDPglucose 6-dehydrogenase/GDP-mannose 6-dehydrogenase